MTGNTLEQRARELLAAEYGCDASELTAPEIRAAAAALRLPAGADWVQDVQPTTADVAAWMDRHDLRGSFGTMGDAFAAFDDARSLRPCDMLAAAPRHEPGEG